ncbi:MAG TPA: hypothetical protein VOA41_07110 [Candidatus Dormibacteraeota bacterium]|nr:hypothetical protein [Candidatus Dormibacteraeota bacterium]
MTPIELNIRQTRVLHAVMLFTMFLYALVGEKMGPIPSPLQPTFYRAFVILAAALVVVALVLRSRILAPAVEALKAHPDDSVAWTRWRVGNTITFVLCESVALFGFALRMLGGKLAASLPLYAAAILLMLIWAPRLDVSDHVL